MAEGSAREAGRETGSGSAGKRAVVMREPLGAGWRASVESEPGQWERGDTVEEAVHKLCASYPDIVAFDIDDKTRRGTGRCRIVPLLIFLPVAGCANLFTSFYDRVSPSGVPCSDLPVVPDGQVVGKEFHRLPAVASDWEASDDASRVESLRRKACVAGADGIIEVQQEEVRHPKTNMYHVRIHGTSVRFLRPRREGGDRADTAADPNARISRPRFPVKGEATAVPGLGMPRLDVRP